MSFDLNLFGNKLLRCRESLQLSQAEVSEKVGMLLSHFKSLEAGKVTPTGDEVLILADFFKQDYQFFITNDIKSAIEQVQILYRRHGSEFSKQDRWVIQEFLYLCECEQQAFDLTNFKVSKFDFKPEGHFFKSQGAQAAEELRQTFGLKADSLIMDVYGLFRRLHGRFLLIIDCLLQKPMGLPYGIFQLGERLMICMKLYDLKHPM